MFSVLIKTMIPRQNSLYKVGISWPLRQGRHIRLVKGFRESNEILPL